MGEVSGISWTDATFNPWRGCTKVSPGCDNCYAETLSHRNPAVLGEWGSDGKRAIAAESYWREPLRWNAKAAKEGVRRRVFCLSLGDFAEARLDLQGPRARLGQIILKTPWLDWLLLTKRPQLTVHNALVDLGFGGVRTGPGYTAGSLPKNVWLGVSVEDQERAEERVPALLALGERWGGGPLWLSLEPLIGPVRLRRQWLTGTLDSAPDSTLVLLEHISWLVVGGESGDAARPMHLEWVRSLLDQAQDALIPFHLKQWGEWGPTSGPQWHGITYSGTFYRKDEDGHEFVRVGKRLAGRELDGRVWDEFPTPRAAAATA